MQENGDWLGAGRRPSTCLSPFSGPTAGIRADNYPIYES
jgi:hypothetical protein